jgi:hypothetical protein
MSVPWFQQIVLKVSLKMVLEGVIRYFEPNTFNGIRLSAAEVTSSTQYRQITVIETDICGWPSIWQ